MLHQKIYETPAFHGKEVKCASCGLANVCIPHGLNAEELGKLSTIIENKLCVERGAVLFSAADEELPIFAVKSGSFKTAVTNEEGMEQITGFYFPGEIIGLDGLGGATPHSTATALETSTVCKIPPQGFDELCAQSPGLRHYFMRAVSKELAHEQQMIMTLGQMNTGMRLAYFFIELGHRFKERGYSYMEYNLSMSRHDLANYLGLAIETLSRLLKKFHNNGIIEVRQRSIKILNYHALCCLANTSCTRKAS